MDFILLFKFDSKWWQVILMCYELVLFFVSFHEMVLFCVTEAILQDYKKKFPSTLHTL